MKAVEVHNLEDPQLVEFADNARRAGYSVVLFGSHGVRRQVDPAIVDRLRAMPGVSSIQITFHPDRPLESHAMPPGGFRLAIVNCWDLAVGVLARERLAAAFAIPGAPAHGSEGRAH